MKENINITTDGRELTIREGKALELREPTKVVINGTIKAVTRFVSTRTAEVDWKKAHILVDRENGTISLRTDETSHYGAEVTASLTLHPDFIKFGVNAGLARSPFEFAEFIKMNRSLFENHAAAMEMVSKLKNLRTKVDKEVELQTDNRGNNKTMIASKVIENSVPEKFKLRISIFKGMPKTEMEVEIYFNPSDLTCTLVSPEAKDKEREIVDTAIDAELSYISASAPDLLIIEI